MSHPLDGVRSQLAAHGVDVLVLRPSSDFRYVTGWSGTATRPMFIVVTPDGPPVLVGDPGPAGHDVQRSGLPELQIVPAGGATAAYAMVGSMIPPMSRVGVDPNMPARELLALQERLRPGTLLASAAPLLSPLRQRKTTQEVAALEQAAIVADRVIVAAHELTWSGATEYEMARRLNLLLMEAGHADVASVLVAAGENSADPLHLPSDRVINPGDVVLLHVGGRHAGYFSRTARMIVVAEPPEDFEAMYSVVIAAHNAACEAVRPGITAAAIHAIAREVISESGYGAFSSHRSGQGIGLDDDEPPYLMPEDDTVLGAGMTLSIEPAIHLPGLYGAHIEDVVVCTELGSRRLNQTPRLLTVVDT
jgi:Xaa-Pro aminopeptidase